jgi:hypothetical protein
MRVGHVACMVKMRNAYSVLVRKPEVKRPLGRTRTILKCIFRKYGGRVWTGII